MKKLLLFCLLLLLLTSCKTKGTAFEVKDLEGFLTSLERKNFTVRYTYVTYNQELPLYDVECTFQVEEDKIYTDTYYYSSDEKKELVHTQKYIYFDTKANTYITYLRQIDNTTGENILSFTKTKSTQKQFDVEFRVGTEIVFNQYGVYSFNDAKQEFRSDTTTIKISESIIYITNSNQGVNTSRRNIKATYELIDKTKINEPSFIRKYKEDIIPGL